MKRLFLFMLAVVGVIGCTHYTKAGNGDFAVGVAGEMSSSLLKGDETIFAYGGVELFANYKHKFGSHFFILPEVGIAQRWHRNNQNNAEAYLPGIKREEMRSISSVFALRPNVGFDIVNGTGWNLGIVTGPEMDWIFAQSHKYKLKDNGSFTNEPGEEICKNNEKKIQWGWNIGVLADINKIRVGINYKIRIGDMTEIHSEKPGELRISVGYRF